MLITFSVRGAPGTKGSVRAFVRGGRAQIVNDSAKARPWTALVQDAALRAMPPGAQPLQGPVRVTLIYLLPRPKGHYLPVSTRRAKEALRLNAPRYPSSKPDLDKLARCALDALSGIVFADDAQIVELFVRKAYPEAASLAPVTCFTVEPFGESPPVPRAQATCDAHATPPGSTL